MDQRLIEITAWINAFTNGQITITPLAGDASFRRYFRVLANNQTFVAMDAPPERESTASFVAIAKAYAEQGIKVPTILNMDSQRGFLLLSDLGDDLYFTKLNSTNADKLYRIALNNLLLVQDCKMTSMGPLPSFNKDFMTQQLQLFPHWFLQNYLQLDLDTHTAHQLQTIFEKFILLAQQQPQVGVHRDYHSRNLLCLPDDQVGVLDFQDAMVGPITYDIVSLLRDCYLTWPLDQLEIWLKYIYETIRYQHSEYQFSFAEFYYWFDWCSLYRHLRILGTFARLYLRDKKSRYLNDMPRILDYVKTVCGRYPELASLQDLFINQITIKINGLTPV